MNWLDEQVSFYKSHADNFGRPASFRDILLCDFATPHRYYNLATQQEEGPVSDLDTIMQLRALDRTTPDYEVRKKDLKNTLQCYTPAALLQTKKKAQVRELKRSGILQLDFDKKDIEQYDLEELKRCVFDLPFIAFCGLSVSGDGFYALAVIDEPNRLGDYAEHCFMVLESFGIKADTSKGKKPENLRYVSYDPNMLIKENPTPLRIKRFRTKTQPPRPLATAKLDRTFESQDNKLIATGLSMIAGAEVGNRWQTVQKWAYTLGGIGDPIILSQIKEAIYRAPQFTGLEDKYMQCAQVCFDAGSHKPI